MFEGVPLPDTAQIQLANFKQKPEECIEDWEDKGMQLSAWKFRELRE
jgi:hypothetical protein